MPAKSYPFLSEKRTNPTNHFQKRFFFRNEMNSYYASMVLSVCDTNIEQGATNILHDIEREQLDKYTYKKRKESYFNGRICGKIAVSDFLKLNFNDFYIANGVFQQPVVHCSKESHCQVSISHTESICASIAFDEKHPMGIDIEEISRSNVTTVEQCFTIKEKTFCTKDAISMALWTSKEAVSKALKMGLTIPLHLLEISSIKEINGIYFTSLKIFSQFSTISFLYGKYIISIAYPTSSKVELFNDFGT